MSREWKTYACRYYHDGKWWGLDLRALDDDDASARVGKLGNLQLLGELKASIAIPGANIFVRALTALRKLRERPLE
jgi:hypothetical protein